MFSRLTSKSRSSSTTLSKPEGSPPGAAPLPALRELISSDLDTSPASALSDWADDACLNRYLRARDDDPAAAAALLRKTLAWRTSRAMPWLPARDSPEWAVIRGEAATGKMFVLPRPSRDGRAVIVMRPGLENTTDPEGNMTYLAYTLERAAAVAAKGGGDGKFVVIVDYAAGKFSIRNAPSISTTKATIAMIQDHYPERLGKSLLFDAPTFFYATFRVVKPFIDPVTVQKIAWCTRASAASDPVCTATLDPENTPSEYGGSLAYQFDADQYFGEEL